MKKYIFKHKWLLVTTVLIRCVGAVMQVYIALMIQQLIDAAVDGDMNLFMSMIIFAGVYFSLMGIVDYFCWCLFFINGDCGLLNEYHSS